MKKIVAAAALLMISASAHAGTYTVEGVTIHVQEGCRSSSCVSVEAPGYGYYHGERPARVHKVQKDTARLASGRKDDTAPVAEATTGNAPPRAPQAAVEAAPASAPPAVSSEPAPAK